MKGDATMAALLNTLVKQVKVKEAYYDKCE
jgi:hypothetical protein